MRPLSQFLSGLYAQYPFFLDLSRIIILLLDNSISDNGLLPILKSFQLGKFTGLYSLNLSCKLIWFIDNNITKRSIRSLLYTFFYCPNLRELLISGNVITDLGLKEIRKVLSKNTDGALQRYAKTFKLDKYDIANTIISKIEDINPIRPLPLCLHLLTLDLSETHLTSLSMKYIGLLLCESLVFLETLMLDRNEFNCNSFAILSQSLKKPVTLKVLSINSIL